MRTDVAELNLPARQYIPRQISVDTGSGVPLRAVEVDSWTARPPAHMGAPPRLLRRARIPRPTLLRYFEAPAAFGTASCCCPRGVLPRLAQDAHIPLAPRHLLFVEMFHQSQRILATGLEHIAYLGNGDATLFMDDFDDARDHFLVSLCEK